jgi:two-component system, chemotaxis family, sensor kinase CheA
MSIATQIESISVLVDRIQTGGNAVAAELVDQLRTLEQESQASGCDVLVQLCQAAASTIQALVGNEQMLDNAELVKQHLQEVLAFAQQHCDASAQGGEVDSSAAPKPMSMPDGREDILHAETVGLFVSNALGALTDLEEELLAVESPGDRFEETVAGIRRTVHTLKAEFGVLNMLAPQSLCHQAETTIDAIVESGASFPVDALLAFGDQIKQFIERLAGDVKAEFGDPEPMLVSLRQLAVNATDVRADDSEPVELDADGDFADSLPEFVSEARSHLSDAEVAMVELSRDPDNVENLNLTFRAFHTIKGVAGFLNLTALVELAHVAETLLDGARSGRFRMAAEDIDAVLEAGDTITQMIAGLEGEPRPSRGEWRALIAKLQGRSNRAADAAPVGEAGASGEAGQEGDASAAPEQATADSSATAVSSTASASPANDAAISEATRGSSEAPASDAAPAVVFKPQAPVDAKKPQVQAARVERTIKVSTTRLDMLVDMVGELVIAQSMVLQDPSIQRLDNQALARNMGQVGKITRDLQEAAMSLRMVTVKSTFQKMSRLVRDVASKAGKRVALSLAGEDTELDRNVVEQISDPLVHMIRNAIDHGIEAPSDRLAAGKDGEGKLALSAYHQGGSIVIEIRDDGRGLDRDKVFAKAVSKGLIPNDANGQAMSDMEVFNLIFLPGFSTAEKVTDLSGRGVGMDVVRRNIEALRGKIEIESTLGEGTIFRLRLPLTLAIIDGMIVRVGSSRYVVPTLSIEQSFRPNTSEVHHVVDRGECVHVRGAVLPIYRLKEVFDQDDGLTDLGEGILIVVEVDGQRSCLFVDEIVGQQQVVIKSLGMSRDRIVGLSGGAIMTDGRVALIVDVGTLVDSILNV